MANDEDVRGAVLAAFAERERAGLPVNECYLAAVETYSRFVPECVREQAAKRAVNIVLAAKQDKMLRVD